MDTVFAPTVLFVFSNPEDSGRLRLDREQRAIDELQRKYGSHQFFHVLSAATVEDMIYALKQTSLRVVHFSGHGSPDGIYLEASAESDTGFQLAANNLTELICSHCPQIEALILASCYSADNSATLVHSAPFVITVEGPAEDKAAIDFTRLFYDNFLESRSVEISLTRTQIALQSLGSDEGLQIYVSRRGETTTKGRTVIQSIKRQYAEETLLIDVTDIEAQIEELDLPKGRFLALLANKINLHRWLPHSSSGMEYAVFPIGKYFAVFSWERGMDLLVCRRILRPKPEATDKQCSLWMRLSFRYSTLFASAYRRERQAVYSGIQQKIEHAIKRFGFCIEEFFEDEAEIALMKELIPEQLKLALPLITENFAAAQYHFQLEDYAQATVHLEATLSIIHGILDGLVDLLAA